MSDVLEGGPRRSGPPRWVWLVAGVVTLVGAGVYAAARRDHPVNPQAAQSPASAPASAPSVSPSPSPWPSAAGACGATAYRPLMAPQPLAERTGVRVLVGGYGLRLVDADTGTARPVRGIPADARHTVSELARAAGVVYALSVPCDGGAGRVYRLDDETARPVGAGAVGDLLAGPARVWAVRYPAAPPGRAELRPLGGGRPLTLPPGGYPVADTSAGLVVAVDAPDQAGEPPRVVVVDPATARTVRTLGIGRPLAAEGTQLLLVLAPCDAGQPSASCTVAQVDTRTGQVHRRYRLPSGGVPASAAALSRDGRQAAFQLARARPDPRLDPGHPLPPADVAWLHLDTGRLEIVPGLELAPKSGAGLVFAADGSRLLATVSDGDHAHLLTWHTGLGAPQSLARLPGPLVWAPPLLTA